MISFLIKEGPQRRALWTIFILAALLTTLLNMNRALFADDDNLWFHVLTYKLVDKAPVTALEEKTIAIMQADKSSTGMVTRLVDKRDYTYNYLSSSALWVAARLAIEPYIQDLSYAQQLGYSLYAEFGLATLVSFIIFLLVCRYLCLPLPWLQALTLLGVISLIASLIPSPKPPNFMILNDSFTSSVLQLSYFILDPSVGFSAFSFTGRNNYIIIMLAFFLARWRGFDKLAYSIMALAMTFHASMGMLMLLTILAIDVLTRPRVLRQPFILASIALSTAYYLMVESLWQKVGIEALYVLTVLAVLLVIFSKFAKRVVLPQLLQRPWQLFNTYVATSRANSDVALFLAGWLATLPLAIIINEHVDKMQSIYFWSQLHVRILSVWHPAIVFFGLLWVLNGQPLRLRGAVVVCILFLVGCLSIVHLSSNNKFHLYPVKLKPTTETLEDFVQSKVGMGVMDNSCYLPENIIHYLVIKELATGKPVIDDYMKKRPKKMKLDCMAD